MNRASAQDGRREVYVLLTDTWRLADCSAFARRGACRCSGVPAAQPGRLVTNCTHGSRTPRRGHAACGSATASSFCLTCSAQRARRI